MIEPIGVKQLPVGTPGDHRGLLGIVVGKIMGGDTRVKAFIEVTEVFRFKGIGVIFAVAHDKDLAALACFDDIDAGLVGFGEQGKRGIGKEIGRADFGVAGMGGAEGIVKAAEQVFAGPEDTMAEDPGDFLGQQVFGDTIMMIERGLCAPADVKGGVDVREGPVHDFAKLGPVADIFIAHFLDGRAGDDKAVILIAADFVKGLIEGKQVVFRGVGRGVAGGLDQIDFNLQGGIGEAAEDLRFSDDFGGHQIKQCEAQRANILMEGAVFGHNENVFTFEDGARGQAVGNFNRQWEGPLP